MSLPSDSEAGVRRVVKSAAAFRTISEVASELDLPQHVLRFWESKFPQIRPMKRGGGRRYYRPEDLELLRRIRALLYDDGYTIKGVQKILRDANGRGLHDGVPDEDEPVSHEDEAEFAAAEAEHRRAALREILGELEAIRKLL
jgi:DNA-binding transcriptional MerR regulator